MIYYYFVLKRYYAVRRANAACSLNYQWLYIFLQEETWANALLCRFEQDIMSCIHISFLIY